MTVSEIVDKLNACRAENRALRAALERIASGDVTVPQEFAQTVLTGLKAQ